LGPPLSVIISCCGVSKSFAAQEKRGSLWNRVNRVWVDVVGEEEVNYVRVLKRIFRQHLLPCNTKLS